MKIRSILSLFISLLLVYSCENEKETYYDRPDWLEPNILNQLQEKGNFNSFITCIEKAGFSKSLNGAGYYTVFAPTDEAFKTFMQEHNISSAENISAEMAHDIVSYAIVQNRYSVTELDDYQTTNEEIERPDIAYKRKTNYYKWTYDEEIEGYGTVKVIDANGVGPLEYTGAGIDYEDNNFKSIPYFTTPFLQASGLSAYDYNYFYPDVTLGDINVANAQVTEADLYAENGIIHITDKVILPLPNIEEALAEKDNYSTFKSILDTYLKSYQLADDYFLIRNEQATGSYDEIFVKFYNAAYFSPNVENYLRYGGGERYDDQMEGFTMFAPDNAAIETFFNEKFLKYYESIEQMSTDQIADFVNAHLWKNAIWPSKFNTYRNIHGELPRFDPETNIDDKTMCSNGFFYGTNIVQGSDLYYTVFGDVSLNPKYSNMLNAINTFPTIKTLLKNSSPNINIQMILLDNDQMDATGIKYNYGRAAWEISENNPLGTNALVALERLLNLHIFLNKDVDFSVPGIYRAGLFDNGEYVRLASFRGRYFLTASGNNRYNSGPEYLGPIEDQASNGQSYTVAEPILFTTANVGYHIEKNLASFNKFYQYLYKSATSPNSEGESNQGFIYNTVTKAITDVKVSVPNTIIIPSDAAIDQAVAEGYLPPITEAYFTKDEQQMVYDFVKYHILTNNIIVPSNDFSAPVKTLYKTVDGDTYVNVICVDNTMEIYVPGYSQAVHIINTRSNVLANRAVIHQADDFLRYPKN
nr:fasciclin domain-containing protein [uncultured Carboxylicivirga sp.]